MTVNPQDRRGGGVRRRAGPSAMDLHQGLSRDLGSERGREGGREGHQDIRARGRAGADRDEPESREAESAGARAGPRRPQRGLGGWDVPERSRASGT